MLLFNTDFENLKKSDSVEKVQLKYSLLLQRYLRFLIKSSLLSSILIRFIKVKNVTRVGQ